MGHNETEGATGCPSTSFGHPQSHTYRHKNTQKKKQDRVQFFYLLIYVSLFHSTYERGVCLLH